MKRVSDFEPYVRDYKVRLQLFKEVIAAGSQQQVADALEIDMKRWNNYERGYPIPREIAFLIMEKFPGMSAEWLWFGMMGNLSPQYTKKIKAAEKRLADREKAEAELKKALKRVDDLKVRKARSGTASTSA